MTNPRRGISEKSYACVLRMNGSKKISGEAERGWANGVCSFKNEEFKIVDKQYDTSFQDGTSYDEGYGMGTEINGMGPQISEDNLHSLVSKIDRLSSGDVLVLAGSIPSCISDDIYRRIMGRLQGRDVKIIVDATSRLLLNVLEYHPFLIKPNQHELGDIFGVKLESKEEVIPYARKLQDMGAVNVLISMGGKGAVLIDEHGNVYEADAPKGELKNSVGAGDSMVAGFMAGYLQTCNYEDAFRMGVATGSASAFSENLATKREISEVLKRVEVTCKR